MKLAGTGLGRVLVGLRGAGEIAMVAKRAPEGKRLALMGIG